MLNRLLLSGAALASLFLATGVFAAGTVKSGPQVGQEVPGPFHPLNVTGSKAGMKNCLYCSNGANPVAVVFARHVTPQVTTLIKKLDRLTSSNADAKMGSFAVFCSDQENLEKTLKNLAGEQRLKSLVLAIDNPAGPQAYHIAQDADVTVVLYNEFTVRSNHAYKTGELSQTGINAIVADVSKILPTK